MNQLEYYNELYPASMSKSVEMLTKSMVKQDILDNAESQGEVHDYIFDLFYHEVDAELTYPDEIGNHVNCDGAGFRVLPNIPIIQAFLKKWNVTPLLEGKKWIVTLEEMKYYWFHEDVASYRMDFESGYIGYNYDFYVKSCPASEIKEEDYEDEPFEKRFKYNEEKEKKNQERLENCTNEELLAELMKRYWDERTIDTDEIKEGLHLMFTDDGKLKPKRKPYDFSQPYQSPFLDYGGDEFHIDPILRNNPRLAFPKGNDE